VLCPNRRRNTATPQTSALQHTAGIEKKTHPCGDFLRHKLSGLAFIKGPSAKLSVKYGGLRAEALVLSTDRK
jgi:hypothetical protein